MGKAEPSNNLNSSINFDSTLVLFSVSLLLFISCKPEKKQADLKNKQIINAQLTQEKKLAHLFSYEELCDFKFFDLSYRDPSLLVIYYEFSKDSQGTVYYYIDRDTNKFSLGLGYDQEDSFKVKRTNFSDKELVLTNSIEGKVDKFIHKNLLSINWIAEKNSLIIEDRNNVSIKYVFSEDLKNGEWDFSNQ